VNGEHNQLVTILMAGRLRKFG